MPTESATSELVLDSSIVIKWFVEEQGTKQADLVLRDALEGRVQLYAPELLLYEVANALWKGNNLPREQIDKAVETIHNAEVKMFNLDTGLMSAALDIMIKYNTTFYDSVYAALAYKQGLSLLTADLKVHKNIKEIKILELKNYS